MSCKFLVYILFSFLVLSGVVSAQEDDFRSNVDYKVSKMTKELTLTESQASSIRPIIKEYLAKREEVLEATVGQGIIDHVSVKSALKAIREKEYQELSKVLNEDQMKKLINKENLMAALNPDGAESTVEDDVGLTPSGANFKF